MDILQAIILTTIIIAIIALIVVLGIYSIRKANFNGKDFLATAIAAPIISESLEVEQIQENGITIPIERLPATTEIDEKRLYEITERTVIARISAVIPAAAETAAKTITNKALKNVELYRVVIPGGATLAKSREIEGAVRGLYRNH